MPLRCKNVRYLSVCLGHGLLLERRVRGDGAVHYTAVGHDRLDSGRVDGRDTPCTRRVATADRRARASVDGPVCHVEEGRRSRVAGARVRRRSARRDRAALVPAERLRVAHRTHAQPAAGRRLLWCRAMLVFYSSFANRRASTMSTCNARPWSRRSPSATVYCRRSTGDCASICDHLSFLLVSE